MAGQQTLLILAIAAAVAGVSVLRLAWSRKQRSAALNAGGWGLMAIAVVLAGAHSGAWGISVAALWGMGAALLWLTYAAIAAPATAGAKASSRRVRMLPEAGEPLGLVRRIVTFLLVALAALIVSAALAIPARLLATLCGAGEGDATVVALIAMPLIWAILACVLLMAPGRAAQWRVLLIGAGLALAGIAAELIA